MEAIPQAIRYAPMGLHFSCNGGATSVRELGWLLLVEVPTIGGLFFALIGEGLLDVISLMLGVRQSWRALRSRTREVVARA